MSRGKGAGGEGREQVAREGSRWSGYGAGGEGREQVEREGSRWRGLGGGGEGRELVERLFFFKYYQHFYFFFNTNFGEEKLNNDIGIREKS